MNRYAEMLVLVRAVKDGSFSGAARNLGCTPSAVSKAIARIEDRLGVLLFSRTHRAITLTREGEAFYAAALEAIAAVESADAAITGGLIPEDTLRVRAMPIFAQAALAPHVPEFCRRHPRLKLEVHLRIDPGHVLDDGMDVAIQVGQLKDSSLVARRFTSTRWIICAAPAYLAAHGTLEAPEDLARHACLNFIPSIAASTWLVREAEPIKVPSRVVANQASMLMELARTGLGIVRLTELQVADDLAAGRLVELFPEQQCVEEDPIFAVYESRRHLSPRVRTFLDFLDETFSEPPWRHWRKTARNAPKP
ncbi:MAG: HTH-type transcriptional regulator DmlR [Enterovirga sp.]|jgi:DNA-binding transcriptional LysR family regulator|nr:HTH-type transcriptional regulator DmlR [Enterovirga sp.]